MTWPTCEACGQPLRDPARCANCNHLKSLHRIDLKTAVCTSGCGIPELACDCEQYQPALPAEEKK